ncbi:MAG: hypothetical protein ACRDK7_03040 [Solirubrobacteraceae bacterium]
MNPHRPRRSTEQLRESYDETLDALRRRFEQLEWAVAQFSPDLDEEAFSAAWYSDDPPERNRADSVSSGFEKTYMLLMDLVTLSVKIAGRLGALSLDEGASSIEVLRELRIISQPAQDSLAVQRQVRNLSQHVYIELTVSALRDAVKQQLDSTPRIVRDITSWVDALTETADGSGQ